MKARIAGFIVVAAVPAVAYVWSGSSTGVPRSWSTSEPVKFYTDASARAALRNSDGGLIIAPGSDPVAALRAAIDSWNAVPGSALRLAPLEVVEQADPATNYITFEDTPDNRSVVGEALAVTQTTFNRQTGQILRARIVFNPQETFSTKLALGAFDLQAIATHELGHALGCGHSHLPSATMFPTSGDENPMARTLSPDDAAFLRDAYPTDESRSATGRVRGRVRCGDAACSGPAAITLVEADAGVVLGGVTDSTGGYNVAGVPPGQYTVYASPYGGDRMPPYEWSFGWKPAFHGGNEASARAVVSGSATVEADVSTAEGAPSLRLDWAYCESMSWPDVFASGRAWSCMLRGRNLPESIGTDLYAVGPGVSVREGSARVVRGTGEMGSILFTLDVAEREQRSYGALALRRSDGVGLLADFTFLPRRPFVVPSDVVHGATGRPEPIAPGEIIAVLGTGLGPRDAGSNADGLSVTFDDYRAPILFADDTDLVVQVPFEVAGCEQVTLRVRYGGMEAIENQLDVIPVSPGVARAVTNADGRRNTPDNPAARGTTIMVRGTGQGVLDPPLATGEPAPNRTPVGLGEVTATLEGMPAVVRAATMAPGELGVFQIEVTIPAEAPAGSAVPLKIVVRGSDRAPEVPVAIR